MAKVKKSPFRDLINKLTFAKSMKPSEKAAIGKFVDKEVKDRISKGLSPVQSAGRYKAYAQQRSEAVGNYPKGIKPKRPVNLKLSGLMLRKLTWKRTKRGVNYGLHGASQKVQEYFVVHNEGTRKDIPRRKIIPVSDGDKFTPKIRKGIRSLYNIVIKRIIKNING